LNALETLLEKHAAVLKQVHEDEKPLILNLSNDLSKMGEEGSQKSADIIALKANLAPLLNLIQDFKRKWETISTSENINDADIEQVAKSIVEKEHLFNEIKSLFTKTEEYFLLMRESQKKESESGVHKKELAEAQAQLQEWHNQAITRLLIEGEISLIRDAIQRFVAQEIKPLSNIINTLYLRAQGNRFINSIEDRPSKDGFLEWIAELNENGESFDKMRSLSQGQRQDLALAIFLARARSLGGTFFWMNLLHI
jgi:DNA repair protein SbcC/Rad50